MTKDWGAVATAIRLRMKELEMTQAEFIHRSRLAPMTLRNLLNDNPSHKPTRPTLATASEALGWPRDRLERVLEGTAPAEPDADDVIMSELAQLRRQLHRIVGQDQLTDQIAAVTDRLDRIEYQIARRADADG